MLERGTTLVRNANRFLLPPVSPSLLQTYNVKEAISDFTLALHYKFPRDYAVFNNRAWCHESLGDFKQAMADYRECK